MASQDGVASLPQWYRRWIIKQYGSAVMALLDRVGKRHDQDIEKYGHKIANQRMRKKMRRLKLAYWTVRMPIGLMVEVYRMAPSFIKNIYWNLIK